MVSRVYGDVYWYLTAVELVGFAGMAIFGPLADMLPLQGIMVGSGIALVLVTIYLQVKSKGDL